MEINLRNLDLVKDLLQIVNDELELNPDYHSDLIHKLKDVLTKHKEMDKMINNTQQRLLGAMQYGISIYSEDGHRWITLPVPDQIISRDAENFIDRLNESGLTIQEKVYGDYEEALDRIDLLLTSLGFQTTSEIYIDFGEE